MKKDILCSASPNERVVGLKTLSTFVAGAVHPGGGILPAAAQADTVRNFESRDFRDIAREVLVGT